MRCIIQPMELQVGVKALIKNPNNEYLLLKRAQALIDGRKAWDIPGGRISADEHILIGLKREIYEETGAQIDTSDARIINAQDIFLPTKQLHIVRITYLIDASIDIALSSEHSEYAYVSLDQALGMVNEPELKATLLALIK